MRKPEKRMGTPTEKHTLHDCWKCGAQMENTVHFRECRPFETNSPCWMWWIECPKCGYRRADMTHPGYAILDWNEPYDV